MRSWWRDDPWGLKAIPWAIWWLLESLGRAAGLAVRRAWRAVRRWSRA